MPSDIMNVVFDNFSNVFGTGKKVTLEIVTYGVAPVISIFEKNTTLDVMAQINVKNPLNTAIDAI